MKRHVTPAGVHEVRSAARRLGAVLSAFKRELPPEPSRAYLRALKRLTRELGPLRDTDVAHQSVEALASARHGRCRDELDMLSIALEGQRLSLVLALQAQMAKSPWFEDVSARRGDIDVLLPGGQPTATAALALCAHRRKRLRARLLKSKRTAEGLHRLRRRVRTLRYLLEEMPALGAGPVPENEVAALVGLQDVLGRLQDLEALRRALRRFPQYRRAVRELRAKTAVRRKHLLRDFDERRSTLLHIWEEGKGEA